VTALFIQQAGKGATCIPGWVRAVSEGYSFCIYVLGVAGKVLVAGGATGVDSVRRCQKLPPCPTEPVPGSTHH